MMPLLGVYRDRSESVHWIGFRFTVVRAKLSLSHTRTHTCELVISNSVKVCQGAPNRFCVSGLLKLIFSVS